MITNLNQQLVTPLLIAESKPEQKDIMIRLAEHFILLKGESV
jgi:predicted secreted protein